MFPGYQYAHILYLCSNAKHEKQLKVSSQRLFCTKTRPGIVSGNICPEQYPGKLEIMCSVWSTIVFERINKCDLMFNKNKKVNRLKDS